MKIFKLILVLCCICNSLNAQSFLGKYILNTPEQSPSAVFLEILNDNTFLYQFQSDILGQSSIKGVWNKEKNKIYFFPQKGSEDTSTLVVIEKMIDTLTVAKIRVIDFTDSTEIPSVEIILNEKDTLITDYLGIVENNYYPRNIKIRLFSFLSDLIFTKPNNNFIEIMLSVRAKPYQIYLPFNYLRISFIKLKGKSSKRKKIVFIKLRDD